MLRNLILITLVFMMVTGCKGRRVTPPPQLITGPILPEELARAFEVKDTITLDTIVEKREPSAKPIKKTNKKATHHNITPEITREQINGKMPLPTLNGLEIPNRRPAEDPVWVGEKICMDVTWLATKAGEFCLEVLPHKYIRNRKVYEFKGTARTSKLFSLIYRAEDYVQSYVDYTGWFPYKFVLHGDESKHIRNNLELFDHVAQKQYVWQYDYRIQKNEVHEDKDIKPLTRFSQDSLSALYFMRLHKIQVGSVINFPMTTGGEQWETAVRVVAHEEIKTPMGPRKAYKAKIETRFYGALRQQGDAFIWLSDDDRRFPLRIEAKVKIGWVTGITKSIEPGTPHVQTAGR